LPRWRACGVGVPGREQGVSGMDDEVRYRVTSGEPSRLMIAYRQAVRGAAQVQAGLIAAGLAPEELMVRAGVSESGRPVVHVTVLPVVAVQLAELIVEGSGGPPPERRSPPPRGDPNAA
jgi:hypothetical protein